VTLVAPWGLLAALLALPLVLFYVLRSRRPRLEVASTFLWQRTDRAVAAAVPWQRFRPDRLFWLVLAAVLLGALALAGPAVTVVTELGDHTILIVDASASMRADEEGPSRLELARRQGAALIDDLGAGQTVSVIQAGEVGRVVLSGSSDVAAAGRALGRIAASQGTADLADALTLAAALERPGQSTVVHLLTDGVLPEQVAAAAPPDLRVHAVGVDRPNLAVSRLEAVATGGGAAQAFLQVSNMGLVPAEATVRLSVDGTPLLVRDLALAPRERRDLVLPLAISGGGLVQATVEPAGTDPSGAPAVDALSLDDTAYATVAGPREVHALVVGEGNLFLSAALDAVDGVAARSATAVPERLDGIDLLVLDRSVPAEGPTLVPTIFVAPARPPTGVEPAGAPVELPSITYQSTEHPVLSDVDLAGTAIAGAQPVGSPALETIVSGPAGPLLLAGRLDQAPVLYLTFDLLESNLPLQVAWPVLMANAVSWLTTPPAAAPLTVGDEARYTVPPGARGVAVTAPGGGQTELDATRPRLVVDEAGIWTAAWTGADEALASLQPPPPVAVNVPAVESDLSRDRPVIAGAPAGGDGFVGAGVGQRSAGRELLAGVLALLLLAWLLPTRRGRPGGRRGPARRSAAAGAERFRRRPSPRRPTELAPLAHRAEVRP
jgi:Ca-activated chloride channel homolog